jgi:hypothetical protein
LRQRPDAIIEDNKRLRAALLEVRGAAAGGGGAGAGAGGFVRL